MMQWVNKLLRKCAVALGFVRKPDLVGIVVSDHPPPEEMALGIVYIIGGPGYQKWAVFRCPRHEDEIIQLSLMPNRRPRWTVTLDILDRPTIHPSVRQLDGPYAHFWVKAGRVEWCADTGRPPPSGRGITGQSA